jgi:hypothetical protein
MNFQVDIEAIVQGRGDPDALEKFFDLLTDEMAELDADNLGVGATLSAGTFEVTLTLQADTIEQAAANAIALLRTAIHAAGGATPGWDVKFLAASTRWVDVKALAQA